MGSSALNRDAPRFSIGQRVGSSRWVVQETLGEGGMGVVYAVTKEPGIEGALKVMRPAFARTPELVGRFLDEARLLVRLRHPNIVQILDFDQLPDGTPFVVMERLHGRTLHAALRAVRDGGGVTPALAYEIIRQLCEGLHCAHTHDPCIVHRDVKPENIFVHFAASDHVVIKLIDFGIATILGGPTERLAFGTPRYMAPEILEGEAASPQADIYSTALVLYQMLAGRFPWDVDVRSASAMAEAHLKLPPARLSRYVPRLPPAVDDCLLSALAKDPSARPASAYEFAARLCLLQFVSDAPARGAVDLDTTAPTLATLAEAVTEGFELDPNDTVRGMQAPAVEGPPPEVASDPSFGRVDTGREAPWFDVQDGAPSAAALRPRTEPSTTPTQTPRAQRRPEHDTLPISSPSRSAGEGPPAQPRAVSASEPPASAVVLEAHAVVTPMTASVSSRGRRRGREAWAAAAVAAALVLPMAGGGVAFFAHKPTAAAPPLARPVPVEEVLTAGGASREARSEPAAGRVGVPAGGPSSLVAAQEPSRAVASIRKVPPPILKPAARAPSASPPLSSSPRPAPPPPMFEW